ncbi:MAG: SDR family NAD(P)-dependent oxidoreductase [Solirubrobacterales bacterium]
MTGGTLHGKVALVTGGGEGFGRAIAGAFAMEGADVAILDRLEEHLDEVVGEVERHGRRAYAIHADVTETDRLPSLVDSVVAELGDLDTLVHNAGVQVITTALEMTEDEWDLAMDVNAKGLFFCSQAVGRYLVEHDKPGKIVNLGSTRAVTVTKGMPSYAASKGAVLQITRALAAEWAERGINVNAIGPTISYTTHTKDRLDDPEFREAYLANLPARRFPEPKDIADAAVFLAGPRSDFIHGEMLMVDSGQTIV